MAETLSNGLTRAMQGLISAVTPVHGPSKMHKDIIQLIIEDHNRGRAMYAQYMMPETTGEQKQYLAWHMIRESSVHSAKEEEVLYPAMRIKLGHEVVDHCLEEHQKLKDGLAALTAASVSDPNFDGVVQEYMQELVKHMHEEEDDLLPRSAAAEGVTSDYLMQLGRVFETSKLLVPSRPHPWAPNKPPLNIITNSACVPLDFLKKDLVRFDGAPPL